MSFLIFITALNSVSKVIKLQSFVAICSDIKKYNPVKFARFVYFRVTHVKLTPLLKKGINSACLVKK